MEQQIVTYESLLNHVKDNGVYLIEDLHTSYWAKYGGGYKKEGTYIEYSFIDYLNAEYSGRNHSEENSFRNKVESIHYYDSIMVLEKK